MVNLEDSKQNYARGPLALEKLDFCVKQLRKGKFRSDIEWSTELVPRLTVEEIVGAIIHARDGLRRRNDE